MRLEEYWGVGPKTRETLEAELGVEPAVRAIETGDVRALSEAGLPRGRATRILRRAIGGEGMALLATSDAHQAYKELLELAADHAVTARAGDRIRVLTPLTSRGAIEARLDAVDAARELWAGLPEDDREAVLAAYARYDDREESERAAVETAVALLETEVSAGPFESVATLDRTELEAAASALAALESDRVGEGVDAELDRLRDALATVEDLSADSRSLVSELREDGVRGIDRFREAFEDRLLAEVEATVEEVRATMPEDATDAADFVETTLRALAASLRTAVDEREAAVVDGLEATVDGSREAIDRAVEAVDAIAFELSLARFALAYDCRRPTLLEGDALTLSVVGARNLTLGEEVQPISYGLGDHDLEERDLEGEPPGSERVAVLTGANSGGKTTLLETLCQIVLLASMGLPVPAERAALTPVDSLVFHRRHASFNAGVLESTLRSIVPPLAGSERTLTLVDEFEAITEPGSAADLLHGLVTLTVDRGAMGVFVTHLADDLEPLPPAARVDGIFAEGLNPDLELVVDYQPRFHTVGRSTPEFIVSRLVANATDRAERAGFETLARAVGQEAVQRTLADARWSE